MHERRTLGERGFVATFHCAGGFGLGKAKQPSQIGRLRTSLVVVKKAKGLDGLLLRVACVHFRRHDFLERVEGDRARTILTLGR